MNFCSACTAAPKMIQYSCQDGVSSEIIFLLMRQHRAVDFLGTFAIMYLTRQPTGRCKLPDPANQQLHL